MRLKEINLFYDGDFVIEVYPWLHFVSKEFRCDLPFDLFHLNLKYNKNLNDVPVFRKYSNCKVKSIIRTNGFYIVRISKKGVFNWKTYFLNR